jgi:hypothetical protein
LDLNTTDPGSRLAPSTHTSYMPYYTNFTEKALNEFQIRVPWWGNSRDARSKLADSQLFSLTLAWCIPVHKVMFLTWESWLSWIKRLDFNTTDPGSQPVIVKLYIYNSGSVVEAFKRREIEARRFPTFSYYFLTPATARWRCGHYFLTESTKTPCAISRS